MKLNTEGMALENEGFELAPPQAASLSESLRAFSYQLPSAIADLVDNSLTANARNIWLDFHWDGRESVISLTDDGDGMTEERLSVAMRLGSQSPLLQRDSNDRGRFGLGLKTASFSQCRRLTVRSFVHEGRMATRCWDLDLIERTNQWQLLRAGNAAADLHFQRLGNLKNGTAVVLQKLDRLVADNRTNNEKQQDQFLIRATAVRQHLAMVFHLILEAKEATLWLNDRAVEPWDPFLSNEIATQLRGVTRLPLGNSIVEVEPFILPHHSRISDKKHKEAGGPQGWNAQQGFYVYRNRRLLVAGDWLGFGWRKEEHYRLARIRVEIPNTLDEEWSIDVTKSRAIPPPSLFEDLRRIGEVTRSLAKRVYSHRGAKLLSRNETEQIMLWEPMAKHGKTFYHINRNHPLVKLGLDGALDKAGLKALLRIIEETVPFPHITIENSESPKSLPAPFEHASEGQIKEVMEQAYKSLLASGYNSADAINRLKTIWPFPMFPALLQVLTESIDHA